MAKHDWINAVKTENRLTDEKVVFGQVLVVPVEKESQYLISHNKNNN